MLKTKYELIKHFAELGFTIGAEIGVAEGYLSEKMFESIPNLELHLIDAWTPYSENRWGGSEGRNEHHYNKTVERMRGKSAVIHRGFSMDMVKEIPLESLDFVYIDACHAFDYVMQDLIEWSKRVRKGGIVSGDDYYAFRGAGVVEAVDAYTRAHGIVPNFTDPLSDKIRDREGYEQPSFWWVKQ